MDTGNMLVHFKGPELLVNDKEDTQVCPQLQVG